MDASAFNPHAFVLGITRNPTAKVSYTVGQLLEMQRHVQECQECQAACDKTLESASPRIGERPVPN